MEDSRDRANAWAINVAQAVRAWMEKENLSRDAVCNLVEVRYTTMKHLFAGDGVIADTTVYAKLYQLNVLAADPRHIPPMHRGRNGTPVERKWTDQQLSEFTNSIVAATTPEPPVEHDNPSLLSNDKQWAKDLEIALRAWCQENGYPKANKLKEQLSIGDVQWGTLMNGEGIVGKKDPTIYARIFLRTNLVEADPRHIPPRQFILPTKVVTETKRSWTEGQWQKFLAEHGQRAEAKTPVTDEVVHEPQLVASTAAVAEEVLAPAPLVDPFVGPLQQLISAAAAQIADTVSNRLQGEIASAMAKHASKKTVTSAGVRKLVEELYVELFSLASADLEERERVAADILPAMTKLWPFVDAFSFDAQEREFRLSHKINL